jgi:uncharacterized DUF497 family protein
VGDGLAIDDEMTQWNAHVAAYNVSDEAPLDAIRSISIGAAIRQARRRYEDENGSV